MHGHFKSKGKKRSFIIIKILLIIFFIYLSFSFCYRVLFKKYLAKIPNEELLDNIINDSKLNYDNDTFYDKYINPEYILKYTINFDLNNEPNILDVNKEVDSTKTPRIFIYSTHDEEEYYDSNLQFYNIVPTVKTAQYILQDYLNDYNLETIVENRSIKDVLVQNNWNYARSYDASRFLVTDIINSNNFDLIIDLHRDSGLKSRTTLEYNNKNYAKFLFIIGGENPKYEANLGVANKLNELLENKIPGISFGVRVKSGIGVNGVYNQDLSNNLLLIELGGQYNEIEELNNSLEILSKCILEYLEGESIEKQ